MHRGILVRATLVVTVLAALIAAGSVTAAGPARTVATAAVAHPVAIEEATRLSFRLRPVDGVEFVPNARNVAIRSTSAGPLLLFLPATRSVPNDYREFLDAASSVGYHVLALDYWNRGRSVARTCAQDARCYGALQANRFDGSHPTAYSAVSPNDSILARLTHALQTLHRRDPAGGWERYLGPDGVRWNRIVLAGHSQGGGESAFIAHGHRVQGVLMFASPVETDNGIVADWMAAAGVTPTSRYFGFDDTHDMYFDRIQGSWAALGLGSRGPQAVLASDPPPTGTHTLVTDLDLGAPDAAHSLIITDAGPRGERNVPVFREVWLWMLRAVRAAAAGTPGHAPAILHAVSAVP